jgi:GNAT superfamily N-acetyltransferase
MKQQVDNYELDDDRVRIDLAQVYRWLSSSYWSSGVSRDVVERAIRGSSLVVGAYLKDKQVGVVRVVSDKATFAWLCDVFVDESHRRHGLGRAMVKFALVHPDHQGLRRWLLATKDAHEVYSALGFLPLLDPDRWMTLRPKPAVKPEPLRPD